jgi:hypothetical protein
MIDGFSAPRRDPECRQVGIRQKNCSVRLIVLHISHHPFPVDAQTGAGVIRAPHCQARRRSIFKYSVNFYKHK